MTACLRRFVGVPCHLGRMTTKWCPACRDARFVEQPPCEDGHTDCPEWVCTVCGDAFVLGWLEADAPVRKAPRRSAPHTAA
jgi:hypothetical protein